MEIVQSEINAPKERTHRRQRTPTPPRKAPQPQHETRKMHRGVLIQPKTQDQAQRKSTVVVEER